MEECKKTTMTDVLEELQMEIAMRLDAQSIGRLRCVSKPWNSLLSSSFFIATWKKPSHGSNMSYLLTNPDSNCGAQICWFSGGAEERIVRFVPGLIEDADLSQSRGKDVLRDCVCYDTVGVIRGVLCLASNRRFKVWNPMIKRVLVIERKYLQKYRDGFGLDPATNELKVVVFSHWGQFYDVVSVRDGRWRRGRIPAGIQSKVLSNSCYWKGAIYWIAEKSSLLVFECGREEWRTVEMGLEGVEKKQLFVYNGMLTVVRRVGGECELWGMKGSGEWSLVSGGIPIYKEECDAFYVSRGSGQQPIGSLEYQPSLLLMDAKLELNKKHIIQDSVLCLPCFPSLPSLTCNTSHYSQCKIPY